ncbi:MAG: MIP/aquaporin family protein [Thermoplasmatota archaeon]
MRIAPELAEAIGTFTLVLVGCGSMFVGALTGSPDHTGIGLSFGLVVAAMIYATGHVSGAHLNPAVTIAFAATQHFPWRRVPAYVIAQSSGAILAIAFLWWLVPDAPTYGETLPRAGLTDLHALAVEFVLTAVLMFVISSVATDGRAVAPMAGIAIGATVGLSALWAGPMTNASMNPARSLGPALFGGGLDVLWLYIVGPVAGALVGATLYQATRRGDRPTKEIR